MQQLSSSSTPITREFYLVPYSVISSFCQEKKGIIMLHYQEKKERGENAGLLYITQGMKISSSEEQCECGYYSDG